MIAQFDDDDYYSPDYLASDICKEELNIAILRQRLTKQDVLYPIYLYSANLPTYLLARQYVDCVEGDGEKLCRAAAHLSQLIGSGIGQQRPI